MKSKVTLAMVALLGCGGDTASKDAGTDATVDVAADVSTDTSTDAPADAPVEATTDGGAPDGNPAAPTCASAVAPDASTVYAGTTCDGQDTKTLSCNGGVAHKEVVVRIDGQTGQVWSVKAQGAFAVGVWDTFNETTCSGTPNLCGAAAPDAGTSGIVDGPFPSPRSDFILFETLDPTPCGPYTIDVTLM